MMVVRFPHAKIAAKKPAISMSCFFVKRCGMHTGSSFTNEGWLYWRTLSFRKVMRLGSKVKIKRLPHPRSLSEGEGGKMISVNKRAIAAIELISGARYACYAFLIYTFARLQICTFAFAHSQPIACSKSAIKSSASSIPTLKRISPSVSPFLILSSRGILACVMLEG